MEIENGTGEEKNVLILDCKAAHDHEGSTYGSRRFYDLRSLEI